MPRIRHPLAAVALLVAAVAGTLAVTPLLLAPRARRPAGTGGGTPTTQRPATPPPLNVPEPATWPLLAAGLAALGGAVAIRRRAGA